jgi:hypothetical protein
MHHERAQVRAIKTAAIKRFGLDNQEDGEWLDEVAERFAKYDLVDALDLIEEHLPDYRFGRSIERKKASRRYGLSGGKTEKGVAPLRPIQDLVKLDDDSAQRILAVSKYLAKIASVDKNVLRYRKNNLGGFMKTMTEEEARERPDHPALLRVCRYLTKQYPWTDNEARYFVLCGAIPKAAKIRGEVQSSFNKPLGVAAHKFNHQTIHMQIPAWMPSVLVRKAYAILQRQAHGGRDPRRPNERNVALFDFVLDRTKVEFVSRDEYLARLKLSSTWADLMREWNELYGPGHPWHYTEASNFGRDFGRGQQAIAATKYALTGIPGEPRTAAEWKASVERIRENLERPPAVSEEVRDEEIT